MKALSKSVSILVAVLLAGAAAAQERLTLSRAIELALERNERAAIAEAEVQAAEARVRRARAFFFPEVAVSSTYTRRAYETTREIGGEDVTIQSYNALNSNAAITATIFDARAFPLYRQAKLLREGIVAGAANDKRLVAFEAADAFITTLSLEQVLHATERRRDLARANLDDATARFEAGLVSSNDVTRAELEFATAEREVTRNSGDVEEAYLQLENLLDTEVARPLAEPAGFLTEAAAPVIPETYTIAQAQETRLDLLAARRNAAALREFAREPSLRFIPTLGFALRGTNTNEGGLSGRESDGNASITLTWPIFDGGERSAERAERLALARAAELDAQLLERGVELDVRRALVGINSDQASIRQAVTAVQVARKNAEETMELYRQGLASALEVTDANVRLFEAEVEEARARYQLALAYLGLRAASGLGPLGEENRS
jgi:outer membrane protein TolC